MDSAPKTKRLKKQHFQLIMISLVILIATVLGTLFTSWITSSKSNNQLNLAPEILFERQGDLLEATSIDSVISWQYVGPNRQSTCNETIFDEFLNFGQTFKAGQKIRLDFDRDYKQHYCFKAIGKNGKISFTNYQISSLLKPIIIFETQAEILSARLSDQADDNLYTKKWQHLQLPEELTACQAEIFEQKAKEIIDDFQIDTSQLNQPTDYCFRLKTKLNDYIYQATTTQLRQIDKPVISWQLIGNQLHLSANQPVKLWRTAIIPLSSECRWQIFQGYHNFTSYQNQPILDIKPHLSTTQQLCIQIANQQGVENYQTYSLNHPPNQIDILIQTDSSDANFIILTAQTPAEVKTWQIVEVASLTDCRKQAFNNSQKISQTNQLRLNIWRNQPIIYCWQLETDTSDFHQAYSLPATAENLILYRDSNFIKAQSLTAEELTDWQYIELPASEEINQSCSKLREEQTNLNTGQLAKLKPQKNYCFWASNSNNQLYRSPIKQSGNLLNNQTISEFRVSLSYDLNLTKFGKAIFYALPITVHDTPNDFRLFCETKFRASCLNLKDGNIHILDGNFNLNNLNELKLAILEAIYVNLLSDNQRQILDLKSRLTYADYQSSLKSILPSNFFIQQIYATDFGYDFRQIIIRQGVQQKILREELSQWYDYYQLFFK
ncbi:MAG: hypothetical protein OXF85_02520 [Candidatus Saccharibacteria bacterium]|nr:hypothetical protein [Candidatus Saccharibacteria bacterium]